MSVELPTEPNGGHALAGPCGDPIYSSWTVFRREDYALS